MKGSSGDGCGKAPTIQELINEDEIVLDSLLIEFAKVTATKLDQAVEKLEDERSIGVALGDGHQVDILMLDMAEGGASQGQDGRANLGVGDDLDSKDIGETWAAVVSKGAKDEVFALLIEYEDSRYHGCDCGCYAIVLERPVV